MVAGNRDLVRLAKELDPTRLAVHVSEFWRSHPHFEADDVICVNNYPSWGSRFRGAGISGEEAARSWREGLSALQKSR